MGASSPLPAPLAAACGEDEVLAWAAFDLDAQGRFAEGQVALTRRALLVLADDREARIALETVRGVRLAEGRGFGRLVITHDGGRETLLFTGRHRAPLSRLAERLERALAGSELEPDRSELRCSSCGQVLPPRAEGTCLDCQAPRRLLGRLLPFAGPYRGALAGVLALTLLGAAVSTLPPLGYLHLIDDGIRGGSRAALLGWGALTALGLVLVELLGGIRARVLSAVGSRFSADLRRAVFAHLQDLGLGYFQRRRAGELLSRVTVDTERIWQFIFFRYVSLLRDAATILFVTAVMVSIEPRLAALALCPLPVVAGLVRWQSTRFQGFFNAVWYFRGRLSAIAGDALPGIRVIKAFGGEAKEVERFDDVNQSFAKRQIELDRKLAFVRPLSGLALRLSGVAVWVLGGAWILEGDAELTLGVLIAFGAYLSQFFGPVTALAGSQKTIAQSVASAHRIFDVLDAEPEVKDPPRPAPLGRPLGAIELEGVGFSYDGAKRALEEISLEVRPGEMIGICGPSGAGKTTLAQLLCRFYDPTAGRVLLDGHDLRDLRLADLRRQIGVVLQETFLFHGTVADNIRYGASDAAPAEIVAAARAAEAHELVMKLPDGYDTIVGERGLRLSGGERQRLAIARALVRDPALLVLDEATSALDVETEARIQTALARLTEGRTTFAISHRLSTLERADRLLVLEAGRVAEVGTHAELLERPGGGFARLHAAQQKKSAVIAVAG